jgi:hypothetical protein
MTAVFIYQHNFKSRLNPFLKLVIQAHILTYNLNTTQNTYTYKRTNVLINLKINLVNACFPH